MDGIHSRPDHTTKSTESTTGERYVKRSKGSEFEPERNSGTVEKRTDNASESDGRVRDDWRPFVLGRVRRISSGRAK